MKGEEMEPISFWWGADTIDYKNRNYWKIEELGDVIMDKNFSMSKPEEQLFISQFCEDLKAAEGTFIFKDSADCWFDDFKLFLDE